MPTNVEEVDSLTGTYEHGIDAKGRLFIPAKLREELYRRGVPREHWDAALEGMDDPAEAIDAFLRKKLRGEELSDPRARKRASDALARRGFRWEDIAAGLRRYGAEDL